MIQTQTDDRFAMSGRSLPCHVVAVKGQIVTVQFDMLPDGIQYPEITIPIAASHYIHYRIQIGDKGVTVAADDVSLRGVSGLGAGIASKSFSGSLTPQFFVPLSNAGWEEEDPDTGPAGVTLKTKSGGASVTVDDAAITLTIGDQVLELSASGLTHNGVNIGATHTHDVEDVESGGSTKTSEVPK
ncbi:phage baseplate protein [Buttiauxella sp. 3AFRM03]|uniref:phage baseplate protein n=1 Tax=Buttiauxella sp. 3AFRM03 TaxID=2479367 RepID=UPI001EE4C6AB|nr:phage baseplate protein [Buttiauxella sp. 3AFRM03]